MSGDFLKDLSADQYARISDLLDESIDMPPGDRATWLAELEQVEPQLAAVLRNMFAARRDGEADRLLQDIPSVLGHKRLVAVLRLARKLAARLWALSVTGS
jgi:hypothetical protein